MWSSSNVDQSVIRLYIICAVPCSSANALTFRITEYKDPPPPYLRLFLIPCSRPHCIWLQATIGWRRCSCCCSKALTSMPKTKGTSVWRSGFSFKTGFSFDKCSPWFPVVFCFRDLVPLHNACSYGHYEVTELLVKVQLSLSAKRISGHAQQKAQHYFTPYFAPILMQCNEYFCLKLRFWRHWAVLRYLLFFYSAYSVYSLFSMTYTLY